MNRYISFKEEDEWVSIKMRDPKDSDNILILENHNISAKELLSFLEENGIISLTDEI